MNLHQIKRELQKYNGVKISEKELREYISVEDYEEYYRIAIELINNNIITPVKSSGSNGMRPPLYKRFTIIKPKSNYDDLIHEIRLLDKNLNREGYLNNPEKYQNQKQWLLPLDNYLKNNSQSLEIPLSINERSFEIFGQEKALKSNKHLAVVLSFNPGLKETLNFYNTPEPFFTYNITSWKKAGEFKEINILIIENKDTWYTLKNIMSPESRCIGGIYFDSLIYGEGKKIYRKIDSLTDYDKSYFKGVKTRYYYFGDLDYEGIGIAHDLMNTNPSLQIELMLPLYIDMLDAAKDIQLPVSKENQSKKAIQWFLSLFERGHEAGYKAFIKSILECGQYIPQEILNNSYLIKMLDNEGEHHV